MKPFFSLILLLIISVASPATSRPGIIVDMSSHQKTVVSLIRIFRYGSPELLKRWSTPGCWAAFTRQASSYGGIKSFWPRVKNFGIQLERIELVDIKLFSHNITRIQIKAELRNKKKKASTSFIVRLKAIKESGNNRFRFHRLPRIKLLK